MMVGRRPCKGGPPSSNITARERGGHFVVGGGLFRRGPSTATRGDIPRWTSNKGDLKLQGARENGLRGGPGIKLKRDAWRARKTNGRSLKSFANIICII